MVSKKVYKTLTLENIEEFTGALANVVAREDTSNISFHGNIVKPGDVGGAESRFNITWEEPETF